jgi:predicted CXXCH cytochrome family protein
MYRKLSYADGQMRDVEELYNYLPFKESKMFAAGVTCSDCHDPHRATLRAPGDGVCLQCHKPAKYENVSHRHHENVSSTVSCVSCHMPERATWWSTVGTFILTGFDARIGDLCTFL